MMQRHLFDAALSCMRPQHLLLQNARSFFSLEDVTEEMTVIKMLLLSILNVPSLNLVSWSIQ